MEEEQFCFLQECKFSSHLLTNLKPNLIIKEAQRNSMFFILLPALKLTITPLKIKAYLYGFLQLNNFSMRSIECRRV